MAITDITERATKVQRDTDEIRQTFGMLADIIAVHLNKVVRICKKNGTANIAAELRDDAAQLATAFAALKQVAQSLKNVNIDNIP